MAKSHIITLPSQELSALLCAATAPQFAQLFDQLPAFRAALLAPVDNKLHTLTSVVTHAIREVCANTNYPEEWVPAQRLAERVQQQLQAQESAQASAPARPAPKPYGNTACPCCTGQRIVRLCSRACDHNYLDIPHLELSTEGYMPSNMGIPGDSDGPAIEVCLDCGRVVNGDYPLPDDVLQQRVAKYKEDRL